MLMKNWKEINKYIYLKKQVLKFYKISKIVNFQIFSIILEIHPNFQRRRDVLTRHMSTRHQAIAPPSILGTHRNVRR